MPRSPYEPFFAFSADVLRDFRDLRFFSLKSSKAARTARFVFPRARIVQYTLERFAMIILITAVHIVVCFFLIIVVLLQSGQSGDIAAAFGGQGSQTAFGPRGSATALSRATTWSAIIFMVTSVTLSIAASRKSGPKSVLQGLKPAQTNSQPAAPAKK